MMKLWADVNKFSDYQVSYDGEIRSFKSKNSSGFILKQFQKAGYKTVSLRIGKRNFKPFVHRLVAEAFCSNPSNKPFVNHKDSNRSNNIASNLEWVTSKENSHHAKINGRLKSYMGENHWTRKEPHRSNKGATNGRAKLTNRDIKRIRSSMNKSLGQIAKEYNVTKQSIFYILKRKTWRHL